MSRRDDDLTREVQAHLDLEAEDHQEAGLPADQARQAALRTFGNPTLVKEQVHDMSPWLVRWWERLQQDLHYGVRAIRRNPGFASVVILSLALGIGANTAMFSILNTLVLKTLPVREPERLAVLDSDSWTNPIWEQLRARQHTLFDGAFAWSAQRFDVSEHGEAAMVDGAYASGGIFSTLGVRPALGRLFTEADDVRGGGPDGPVAVIGYGLWQRRYAGTPAVIGQRITVERVPFTVIGVMPQGFFGPDVGRVAEVFLPLASVAVIQGSDRALNNGWMWWLAIMVRQKTGQSLEETNVSLRAVQPQIRAAALPTEGPTTGLQNYLTDPMTLLPAATGTSALRARYQQPLSIILVVVSVVLFIACANIANLVLSRANARRHELTVRLALGASRLRLARQLLTESLLLALVGAALGLVVAKWGAALIVAQLGSRVSLEMAIDWRVLAFTAGIAVATALLFGLSPALSVARLAPNDALKEQSRSVTGDRRFGLRNVLVVTQLALSVMLVAGAGLFLRTLVSLTTVPLGFEPAPLLVVSINAQQTHTPPEGRGALYDTFRQVAAATPGVASAALSDLSPLSGQGWNTGIAMPGEPSPAGPPRRDRMSWMNALSPGWFATYGTRLLAGRDFTSDDRTGAEPVAVVNQAFASRFFKGENPVGREVLEQAPGKSTQYRIVGLVEDAVYRSSRQGTVPTMYVPLAQLDDLRPGIVLTVRAAAGPPEQLSRGLASALGRAHPDASFSFRSMRDFERATMAQERLVAGLSGAFGVLALVLASIGLYGVTSYSVNRRRGEIGIRMALGAGPGRVIRLILTRVGWLVALGVVLGATLSVWASRFIATSLLFGIESRDPSTLITAAVVLITVGILAGWLPARRAGRIDPTTVLRES